MRLMNRSADGKRQTAGESGLLPRLGSDRSLMLAEAVTDLRKLLRVKVEDDQDLVTAQQALSEAGYFCSGRERGGGGGQDRGRAARRGAASVKVRRFKLSPPGPVRRRRAAQPVRQCRAILGAHERARRAVAPRASPRQWSSGSASLR